MPSPLEDLKFMFQPIARLASERDDWSEALVRWQMPDGTVRGPLDILPRWLAPARIEIFTHFTLLRGAQALAAHPMARLSINLTPAQILLPEALRTLEGMLPSVTERLYIEVVEGGTSEAPAMARQLWLLRERCGGIFLDDVTPHDLSNRVRFDVPVDGVKLDRSVVYTALYEGNDALRETARDFVRSTSERYAVVVAEGIEDLSACEELRALGASHVQGFGIAKPGAELRTGMCGLLNLPSGRTAVPKAPVAEVELSARPPS